MTKKFNLMPYKKGQVWMMCNEEWTSQQRDAGITVGDRPVIIYSNILIDRNFIHIIPLSSNPDYKNGVIMNLCKDDKTIALVQECRPVSMSTLTTYLGAIDDTMMTEIDNAISVYFGLKTDPTIEQRFFAFSKGRNKIYDAPVNQPIPNNPDPKNTQKPKKKPDEKPKFGGKRYVKPKAINVDILTDDEIIFICTGKLKVVAEKYKVSMSTVNRYKNELKEKAASIIEARNSKSEDIEETKIVTTPTTPTTPQIVRTTKYRNKTYKKFATKKIAKLTCDEKRLFTQLDSFKLSTAMNIPMNVICTTQQAFKEELGL